MREVETESQRKHGGGVKSAKQSYADHPKVTSHVDYARSGRKIRMNFQSFENFDDEEIVRTLTDWTKIFVAHGFRVCSISTSDSTQKSD